MRLLILSFYFRPDLSAGSFRTTSLVDALVPMLASDDRVDVLTTQPNRYHSFSQEATEHEGHGSLQIHRIQLPPHRSGMLDQSRAFLRFARQVLDRTRGQRYDVVYATSSRLFTAALGAMVARRTCARLLLDIRDIFVDTMQEVLNPVLAASMLSLLRIVERWTMHQADQVNLVSEGFREYFSARYPDKRYSYLTNGIDDEFLNADFSRTGPAPERRIILYAGNFGAGQGLHRIVPEMATRLRDDYEFWLVGDGGRKQELLDAVERAGADNVRILAPLDRPRLIELYRQCDYLFLHLNDFKAFRKVLPSKIFEYAATGKPILAGVAGYAARFLQSEVENSSVFPPCDPAAGIKALAELNPQLQPRRLFIEQYRRSHIMHCLAQQLIDLAVTSEVA